MAYEILRTELGSGQRFLLEFLAWEKHCRPWRLNTSHLRWKVEEVEQSC